MALDFVRSPNPKSLETRGQEEGLSVNKAGFQEMLSRKRSAEVAVVPLAIPLAAIGAVAAGALFAPNQPRITEAKCKNPTRNGDFDRVTGRDTVTCADGTQRQDNLNWRADK